jgi:hypothetical protein
VSGERIAVRIYSTLVGLYPREFRDEYGADMIQLMRDQCDDEPSWRVTGRIAIDLALTLPAQQLETRMNRTPNRIVPHFYAAVAAAGALLALVGGTNTAMLVIGLTIAVVAGVIGGIAWRRTGSVGGPATTSGWWKFVLAGPCIIVGVIIAAGLGVDAWFVGVLFVFAAFVLVGIGVLLGITHLTRRHSALPNVS